MTQTNTTIPIKTKTYFKHTQNLSQYKILKTNDHIKIHIYHQIYTDSKQNKYMLISTKSKQNTDIFSHMLKQTYKYLHLQTHQQ